MKIDSKKLNITDTFDLDSSILVGRLDFETYDKLYKMLEGKYGKQIDQKFLEIGARTLVVCKENGKIKVAGKSDSPYYPSDDEFKKIQKEMGKVCYITGRDIIEESGWTFIPQIPENSYPTIPIYLGKQDEECEDIIRQDRLIISDFDTGNHDILAFKDEYRDRLLIPSGLKTKKAYWIYIRRKHVLL